MTKVNLSATARRIRDLAELSGATANMTRTEFVHAARPDGHTRVRTRSRPLHVEAVYGPAGRERAAVALVAGVDRGMGAYADHYTLAPLVVTSVVNGGGYAPGAREQLAVDALAAVGEGENAGDEANPDVWWVNPLAGPIWAARALDGAMVRTAGAIHCADGCGLETPLLGYARLGAITGNGEDARARRVTTLGPGIGAGRLLSAAFALAAVRVREAGRRLPGREPDVEWVRRASGEALAALPLPASTAVVAVASRAAHALGVEGVVSAATARHEAAVLAAPIAAALGEGRRGELAAVAVTCGEKAWEVACALQHEIAHAAAQRGGRELERVALHVRPFPDLAAVREAAATELRTNGPLAVSVDVRAGAANVIRAMQELA